MLFPCSGLLVVIRRLSDLNEGREVEIVLRGAILHEERHLTAVAVRGEELELRTLHEGHIQVVARGAKILRRSVCCSLVVI